MESALKMSVAQRKVKKQIYELGRRYDVCQLDVAVFASPGNLMPTCLERNNNR
jgi:hypothetical protein